jgi:hypothetical protein
MIGDADVPEEFPKPGEESDRQKAPAELWPLLLDEVDRLPEQGRAESLSVGKLIVATDLYAGRCHLVQADLYLSLAWTSGTSAIACSRRLQSIASLPGFFLM